MRTHYKWPFSIAMLNYQRVVQGTSDGEQAVCNPSCATWAYFHHVPSIHACMHGWMHASILRLGSVRLDQIPLHYNTIYTLDCSTVPHHTIRYHTILYHTRLYIVYTHTILYNFYVVLYDPSIHPSFHSYQALYLTSRDP